LLAVAV